MKPEMAESEDWSRVVQSLRDENALLAERLAALEAAIGMATVASGPASAPAPAAPLKPEPAPQPEGLSEELVLVIGAAIAAFLGKKAHIRQIRLLNSTAWAEHGRVTIQASHALSTHHR
jgi:methylmalonyl-CoA carboxyltransferase large subunit